MQFLTDTDLDGIVAENTLTQLRGAADENLDSSERLALSELDPLRENFDIDGELAKSGTGRNTMLVRLLVHITVYYLFNAVEDVDIPDRIMTNYTNARADIEKIASGKKSSTIDVLIDDETDLPKSRYRWGSDAARDNDIF